ncbi:hypothetical protein L1887_63469 [Cichorium endivia]|nr:hypothetical protein L1887_63469 [Cichorium endivia]
MAHPDGELATSRACAKAGVNMGISSYTNHTVGQIREAGLSVGPVNHAMQLYTMRDRDLELRIIREAEERGCKAIFLTADSPVLGVRFNEWRNDFRTPPGFGFPMLELTSEKIRSASHDSTQLDGVPATLDALPECVEAAAGRIRIHVDGGVRTGFQYDGQKGVELMLETLYNEFKRCMQLTGCNSVKDITRACLGVPRPDGPLARQRTQLDLKANEVHLGISIIRLASEAKERQRLRAKPAEITNSVRWPSGYGASFRRSLSSVSAQSSDVRTAGFNFCCRRIFVVRQYKERWTAIIFLPYMKPLSRTKTVPLTQVLLNRYFHRPGASSLSLPGVRWRSRDFDYSSGVTSRQSASLQAKSFYQAGQYLKQRSRHQRHPHRW